MAGEVATIIATMIAITIATTLKMTALVKSTAVAGVRQVQWVLWVVPDRAAQRV